MKNIKELELLVNFARSLGQTPDPEMVEQIREHYEFQKKIVESVKANSAKDLNTAFGQEIIKETTNELVQTPPRKKVSTEEILSDTSSSGESIPEQSLAARAAKHGACRVHEAAVTAALGLRRFGSAKSAEFGVVFELCRAAGVGALHGDPLVVS